MKPVGSGDELGKKEGELHAGPALGLMRICATEKHSKYLICHQFVQHIGSSPNHTDDDIRFKF
jgi:hypothetical protein